MIIGLDVGGTHTDVVLLDRSGLLKKIKVTTDPSDLFNSVLTGLIKITEGIEPEKIHRIVLSTTLTTNAIGAALARTTCEVIFYADTQKGVANAPAENYFSNITRNFDSNDAVKIAFDLLKQKALQRGANPDNIEMEVLETMQFNMVRGFSSTGKNIRVKVQVKPGLIHGYDDIIGNLQKNDKCKT